MAHSRGECVTSLLRFCPTARRLLSVTDVTKNLTCCVKKLFLSSWPSRERRPFPAIIYKFEREPKILC